MADWLNKLNLAGCVRLMPYLRPYRGRLAIAVLCGISHHLLAIAASSLAAYLVGLAAGGGEAAVILQLLPLLAFIVTLRVVMHFADMWVAHEVAFKILKDFRGFIYRAVEKVAPAYLLNMRSGDLASTLMSDTEVLEWFFAHTAGTFLVAVATAAITLLAMGWIHWLLPLCVIPWMLLIFSVPLFLRKKADRQGMDVRERMAGINAETVDGVQGLREIVAYNFTGGFLNRLKNHSEGLDKSLAAYGNRLGIEGALLNTFIAMAIINVLGMAAYLVAQEQIPFYWLPVAVIMAANIFAPVLEVTGMGRNFGLILAAAKRVFTVLEAKETIKFINTGKRSGALTADIQFEGVAFTYSPNLPYVLDGVDFKVAVGESVALVGHSGAGKTTCLNLLQRFWDVEKGRIKIGGVDLRDLSMDELRTLITVVPQDVYLFNTTILENIRLGKPGASLAEVRSAAKAAYIHEFIAGLPAGYETNVGERGISMSGGQKQRVAIARAFLTDAPILIMDEALASLDTENERLLQASVKNLRHGRTTIFVAHRLSTFREADKLVVLDQGRVVQSGPHSLLINQPGYYREFVSAQMVGES